MFRLILTLALAQASPVVVSDPTDSSKRVTSTDAGVKRGLDVFVLNPSAGGGASSGVLDGGDVGVTQRPGTGQGGWVDGGFLDGIKNPIAVEAHVVLDGGPVSIAGRVTVDVYQVNDGGVQSVSVTNVPHVVVDTAPSTAVTNSGLSNIDVLLSTRTKPADQQHTVIDSSVSIGVTGPLTDAQLRATPVSVASTDTAGSGQGGPVDGGWIYASGADGGALVTDATAAAQQATLEAIRRLLEAMLDQQQQQQAELQRLH